MGLVDDTLERLAIGMPIFLKLSDLPHLELIEVLKKVLVNHPKVVGIFSVPPILVRKTIDNDEVQEINIISWNCLKIHPLGIYYKPEHGTDIRIIDFDKYFTLGDK